MAFIQVCGLSNHIASCAEASQPRSIAEDHNIGTIQLILSGIEIVPENRPGTECLKEAPAYAFRLPRLHVGRRM